MPETKPLTVAEIMEVLRSLPADMPVYYINLYECEHVRVTKIEVQDITEVGPVTFKLGATAWCTAQCNSIIVKALIFS